MTTEERSSAEASTDHEGAEGAHEGAEGAEDAASAARRAFLVKCGRLAVITPPAVTLMLSAASHNYAVAGSGRHHLHHRDSGNNGFGNGGRDGSPNGKEDDDR